MLALVAWAVYRQVRGHLELRRALRDLAAKQQVLVDRLTAAIEVMEKTELQGSQLRTLGEIHCIALEDLAREWLPETLLAAIDSMHIRTRYVWAIPRIRGSHELARAWEHKENGQDAQWYASAAAC